MSGHTPGPWDWTVDGPESYYEPDEGHLGSITSGGVLVCDFGSYRPYEHSPGVPPKAEDRALLLHAPTMLSAIEQFEAWWQEVGQVSFNGAPACVFALREAAAKARGGV